MTLDRADRLARLIVALFVLIGCLYSLITPVMEKPDEVYHYPLIKHLADGHGLPVQRQDADTLYRQEGSQPPLYYLLMAGLTGWIDSDDLVELRSLNPHAQVGIALASDNQNMIIHTEQERWPWQGATLAIHLVRLASLAMGAVSLWCGYWLARRLFADQPLVALGAMVFTAFNPMYAFISSSVNNDNLIILITTVTLSALLQLLQEPADWRQAATLGLFCGLGALSKLSGLLLLPLTLMALVLQAWRRWRRKGASPPELLGSLLGQMAIIVAVTLAVSGWWYARNLRLYGEFTGIQTMLDIFGRREKASSPLEIWQEFAGFRYSYWGLFGMLNVPLRPWWLYHLLDALSLAALIGLARWLKDNWRTQVRSRGPCLLLMLATPAAFGVSLLRWTSMTPASQGRLIYPAIAAISLFLSLGWLALFPASGRRRALLGLAIGLGAISLSAPFTAIAPAYRRPEILTRDEIPPDLPRIEASYEDSLRLVAYQLAPREVAPGESFELTLYWECLQNVEQDPSAYIHVFGRDGAKIGQRDSLPGMGQYAPHLWQPGEVIRDVYRVTIDEHASGPVAALVEVGLYDLESMTRLPVTDGLGRPVDRALPGRIKVAGDTPPMTPSRPVDALLGERVWLRGYDLESDVLQPGQQVALTLYWEALQPLPRDYTVFVHLVSTDGTVVGQGDGPPLDGEYPTSYWGAGDYLRDRHQLEVDADAPPGLARLRVGLYDPETGQRLPLGTDMQGTVELAILSVAP